MYPWGHGRRYNSYADYIKKTFGSRVQKLSIDAGFTCPNRDGSKGLGGCSYCDNDAFNPSYCDPKKTVQQQIAEGIEFHENRYRRANRYLAYFQAYSNTYAPLSYLKNIYEQALSFPNIAGLVIGTRPDCIDEEKLAYFADLASKVYIQIEYGIESCYDRTLQRINRGHSFQDTLHALDLSSKYNLRIGAHMIFGLPGESKEDMLAEAKILSELPVQSLKFHQLQIMRNTKMEKEYKLYPEDFLQFALKDYIDFVIDFTEMLNPEMVIERFSGEAPPRFLVKSEWGLLRNDQILNLIEERMKERDSWQGKYYSH